jgi:putative resolvase
MKLSQYAKQNDVTYRTAWNRAKRGTIPTVVDDTGHIRVVTKQEANKEKVAIYARVSSSENKNNLQRQCDRLIQYCVAKGYQIIHVVKEVASGVNDERPKLLKLLSEEDYGTLVVEHKDRLTRFGFNYIKELCNKYIEVVNEAEGDEQDIIQDFVSIITSYCAKIYGKRRSKRKTEKLIEQLKKEES